MKTTRWELYYEGYTISVMLCVLCYECYAMSDILRVMLGILPFRMVIVILRIVRVVLKA